MTREIAIKTAAKWWANKLKARPRHSNGDNSPASVIACLLADMGTDAVQDNQLERFRSELVSEINNRMDTYGDHYAHIGCDYGPCSELRAAAEKAGINVANFPFKTSLSIIKRDDKYVVYAYDGYRAPREELQPCEERKTDNA